MKCLLLCSLKRQIIFRSPLYPGHVHDFSIFKQECGNIDFSNLRLHVDLGFLGIQKVVPAAHVFIPHKNYRTRPLTAEQKQENTSLSRIRVVVENVIAGMKAFFVLRIKNRMKDKQGLEDAIDACVLLANLKALKMSG